MVVHPTYVDIEAFRKKATYDFDAPLIWVGRLSEQKNLVSLIHGCALAGRDLDLVGAGDLEGQLRALAAAVPINIRFLGQVANDRLPALLREYSIFVLPSFHEGLPKALIEAMSCGLVCLASNISGVNELIKHEHNGLLIGGFDAHQIAAVIERATRERDVSLGRQARLTIEQGFTLDSYAMREAGLYAALDA